MPRRRATRSRAGRMKQRSAAREARGSEGFRPEFAHGDAGSAAPVACGLDPSQPKPAVELRTAPSSSLPARPLRPFGERIELGPGDLRMGAAAEAAVGAGDYVLDTDQAGEA